MAFGDIYSVAMDFRAYGDTHRIRVHLEPVERLSPGLSPIIDDPESRIAGSIGGVEQFGGAEEHSRKIRPLRWEPFWGAGIMERIGLAPDVRFGRLTERVSQIRQQDGARDIFLFVHSGLEEAVELTAEFPGLEGRTAWRWDPETGRRALFSAGGAGWYNLRFEPLESLPPVFEPGAPEAGTPVWRFLPEAAEGQPIAPVWTVRLEARVFIRITLIGEKGILLPWRDRRRRCAHLFRLSAR